jgi:hypothetical protein
MLKWSDDKAPSAVNSVGCGQSEVLIPVGVRDFRAVPWLRWSVAGLSQRRPVFSHILVHVGFIVGKGADCFPCTSDFFCHHSTDIHYSFIHRLQTRL